MLNAMHFGYRSDFSPNNSWKSSHITVSCACFCEFEAQPKFFLQSYYAVCNIVILNHGILIVKSINILCQRY